MQPCSHRCFRQLLEDGTLAMSDRKDLFKVLICMSCSLPVHAALHHAAHAVAPSNQQSCMLPQISKESNRGEALFKETAVEAEQQVPVGSLGGESRRCFSCFDGFLCLQAA